MRGVLIVCLAAAPALAQQTLAEDFEGGISSAWTMTTQAGAATFAATSGAAHRGDAGLHIALPTPAAGADAALLAFAPSPPYAGSDYFVRYWTRHTLAGTATDVPVVDVVGGGKVLSISVNLGIADGGASGWRLDELYVHGVGTPDASVATYSNAKASNASPVDMTGWTINTLKVGLTSAGGGGFSGSIDYDDIRISTSAPAAAIDLTADAGLRAGSCVFIVYHLHASDGSPAPAPRDTVVNNTIPFGSLYSDPGCTVPISTVTLAQGETQVGAWLEPEMTGAFPFDVGADDLVSTRIIGIVGAALDAGVQSDAGPQVDAGSDAGEPVVDAGLPDAGLPPRLEEVACGCSSGRLACAALAALLLRRRPRPRANFRAAWK